MRRPRGRKPRSTPRGRNAAWLTSWVLVGVTFAFLARFENHSSLSLCRARSFVVRFCAPELPSSQCRVAVVQQAALSLSLSPPSRLSGESLHSEFNALLWLTFACGAKWETIESKSEKKRAGCSTRCTRKGRPPRHTGRGIANLTLVPYTRSRAPASRAAIDGCGNRGAPRSHMWSAIKASSLTKRVVYIQRLFSRR